MENLKVSFIGLGIMGSRMAANLLKKNVDLTVYNRSEEPAVRLEKDGARKASTAKDAVSDSDIVFTMLSDPKAVESVVVGPDGCLSSMKKGALWVDCSTVNPSFSRSCRDKAVKHGVRFVDAPVAGTKPHAENGELVFFVGSEDGEIKECEPLLDAMGQKVVYARGIGMGSSIKMVINLLLGQSMAAFSEAFSLGKLMGVPREALFEILLSTPVVAPVIGAVRPKLEKDDYEPNFPLKLMKKDLHLASLCAYENGVPFALGNSAKDLFTMAENSGLADEDFSAVFKFLTEKR